MDSRTSFSIYKTSYFVFRESSKVNLNYESHSLPSQRVEGLHLQVNNG